MTYFVQRWRPFPFSPFFVSLTDSRITAKEITYKTCNSNIQSGMSEADPGFFVGGGALLRNGVIDWWRKQILIANTKKKAFD